MTRTVNANIVDAWSACVTQTGGLTCYQKPGENVIGLTYEELANTGDLKNVSITLSNMKVPNQADAKPILYTGDTGLAYTITDSSKDATFLLNGRTELSNYAQSCSVFVKSPGSIRTEVGNVWHALAMMYFNINSALNTPEAEPYEPFRTRVYDAVMAKGLNALSKWGDCFNNRTCNSPQAADYRFSFSTPGVMCNDGKILVAPATYAHNVLTHTPASEVELITSLGVWRLLAPGFCASRGGFRMY
jgi:hypothetical protein